MAQNDVANDTAQDMSDKAKGLASKGANKVARKVGKAGKKAIKKLAKKATKAAVKFALKAIANILKIILQILLALWPYVLGLTIIILLFIMISGWFTDEEFESKAALENYQTEEASEDNDRTLDEDGNYKVTNVSNGNKLYKMFYGYMAQKGYYKIVVNEDGEAKTDLLRGDSKKAQEIIDKYNREKDFILNSDLLYLLDTTLNAGVGNQFYFPEQFTQPVYHDKKYNLKNLTDEESGELVAKSTKYDKKGKATDKKVTGIWDYGFGSILQYQKYEEDREQRLTASKTHVWDYKKHKLVESKDVDKTDTKTKGVSGYPKDTYMITKITNSIGTIKNKVKVEWQKTNEPVTENEEIFIDGEKQVEYTEEEQAKNKDGELLYWEMSDKLYTEKDGNKKTTIKTEWPVMKDVKKKKWEKTIVKTTKTYSGYVWEKSPSYEGEPDTSGIVGDQYMFDYLTNYETYVPNTIMEDFDIKKRTGTDIEGLKEAFEQQQAVENVDSVYDSSPEDSATTTQTANLSGSVSGESTKYQNSLKFMNLYQIYGKRYGVDPNLLLAIAAQESGGNDKIDTSRYGRFGVGLMQIISSTGQAGVTATNLETGEKDTLHLNTASDHTAEKTVQFCAMYLQGLIKAQYGNVTAAIRGYNSGGGAMLGAMKRFASAKGISLEEAYKRPASEWLSYNTTGDTEYVQRVLSYYPSSAGTPWIMDSKGTKYSADGSVQAGAAVVGNGTSSNTSWFSSLVELVSDKWDELFEDSPADALQNKDDYKWTKHKNHLSEAEFKEFLKMYWSFANNLNYSEVKDEITLEDWKEKYKVLFENPTISSGASEQNITAYEEISKLFKDGFASPADKISKIAKAYDGTMIKLAVSKGAEIKAMSKGEVTMVDTTNGVIEITHTGGIKTRYTGLKGISLKKGAKVSQGDKLGTAKTSELGLALTDKDGNSVDPSPIFEVMGDGSQSYNYQTVLQLIESKKGTPYNMTGDAYLGTNGYFDCSGLMKWAFGQVGINLPRTAQEQYDITTHISASEARPGDLVFFQHTYNAGHPITHVGLYIGNGQFWNANNDGVSLSKLEGYWAEKEPVFGRVKK